jgi:small-conductance mechanosensitive channel
MMILSIYSVLSSHRQGWSISIVALCAALLVALFAHDVLFRILARIRRKSPQNSSHIVAILKRLRHPARWVVILAVVGAVIPLLPIPSYYTTIALKSIAVLWCMALGWLLIAGVYMVEDILLLRNDITGGDNLRARRVRTQMQVLRRLAITLLVVADAGLILSLFHDSKIWHYGAGLLASAGLASLVLATAAKSTASNILAGLQIAMTEPIRIDDVVVVQGEWGRIEEITTSYVVVAIWDQRRLIVPLTYFIEQPFQNWTRRTSDLLGTAFLYVDYSVPVDALRQEFTRVLESTALWDRRVNSLQVTNLSEHTMELRCLASARSSGDLFDLRCYVREKMIDFVQKNYPDAFPRTRFSAVAREDQPSSFLQDKN